MNEGKNTLKEQHTNILFFNNACNCCCEMCYEQQRMKESDLFFAKFEDFKENLDILGNNGLCNCITIFGGEPTLSMNEIYRMIDYCNINYPGSFTFYMNTNTVLLADDKFFEEFKNHISKLNNFITTISYDGSANFRRKLKCKNEDTTKYVFKAIDNLTKADMKFNISYVLGYYNYDCCIKDFIQILLKFKNLNRLILSPNYNELDMLFGFNNDKKIRQKIYKDLTDTCIYLYKKFKKPICEITCPICKKCIKHKGYNYMSIDGLHYKDDSQNFDIF